MRLSGRAYVVGNPLTTGRPLEAAWLSSDTLEALECLKVKVTLWVLGSVIGKVTVREEECRSINDEVSERTSIVMSVRGNRVLDALYAERDHDRKIVTIRTERLCYKLFELVQVEADWVSTSQSQ
jgi:hypothetical protein